MNRLEFIIKKISKKYKTKIGVSELRKDVKRIMLVKISSVRGALPSAEDMSGLRTIFENILSEMNIHNTRVVVLPDLISVEFLEFKE